MNIATRRKNKQHRTRRQTTQHHTHNKITKKKDINLCKNNLLRLKFKENDEEI